MLESFSTLINISALKRVSFKSNLQAGAINCLVLALIAWCFIFFAWGAREFLIPVNSIEYENISLAYSNLPIYALHTSLRMIIALIASVIFTFFYATLAAKYRKAEEILIPLLDILQSVPILGYVSFTITFFLYLFPSTVLGFELAAIFAIFTSQVWNMTLSLYQSLKTIPKELEEAAVIFKLSKWQKFWGLEIPYALPGLIWNITVSMAGGWFFVVAAESIAVGNNNITLPGLGSYIALAVNHKDKSAIFFAIVALCTVIYIYNNLIFTPLLVWSEKFRYEMTKSTNLKTSWLLNLLSRSSIMQRIVKLLAMVSKVVLSLPSSPARINSRLGVSTTDITLIDKIWYFFLIIIGIYTISYIYNFLHTYISVKELMNVALLTLITFLRIAILITLISIILVPLGVYIGLSPIIREIAQPIVQFMASFPANIFFPIAVIYITKYHINPDIWLSPLMIVGTQWYILFNVIAGASQLPTELREACINLNIKGIEWWKKIIIPAILPYYVTGAITASGGAWNASIIAEAVSWGDTKIYAHGVGSYITQMTIKGDLHHVALGVIVMSSFVVIFNKIFWRPLYNYTIRKYSYN